MLAVPVAVALVVLAVASPASPARSPRTTSGFQAGPRARRSGTTSASFLAGREPAWSGRTTTSRHRKTLARFGRCSRARWRSPRPSWRHSAARRSSRALQARVEREPHRLSQQLNNLGVLTMGRYSTDSQEAIQSSRGVGAFQNAIEVDPDNPDALRNLEILLRRPEAATLP